MKVLRLLLLAIGLTGLTACCLPYPYYARDSGYYGYHGHYRGDGGYHSYRYYRHNGGQGYPYYPR